MQEIGEKDVSAVRFFIHGENAADDTALAHLLSSNGTRAMCGQIVAGDDWRVDWGKARHYTLCLNCQKGAVRKNS